MCSYLGTFPPVMARVLIEAFSDPGDLVFDPFSGRGTTMLEARLAGRRAVATDMNPLAVALTRAKAQTVSLEDVLARVEELRSRYRKRLYLTEARAQDESIKLIFHPHTLAELCYLRRRLDSTQPVDAFLVGVVLGVMHGNERQDGESSYASISMPNTFSMSPDYVRRFVQQKQLQRVYREVFGLLKLKAKRLFAAGPPVAEAGMVYTADAKKLPGPDLEHLVGKVNLVVASPPYLNIVNYAKQNWIRMWFMHHDPVDVQEGLDDNLQMGPWLAFMDQVLVGLRALLAPGGVVVLVVGDVAKSASSVVSPARGLIRHVRHTDAFGWVGCLPDRMDVGEKVTRIWSDTKGQATAIERIVVLSDDAPSARPIVVETRQGTRNPALDVGSLAAYASTFAAR